MRSKSLRRALSAMACLLLAAAVVGCGAGGGSKGQVKGKLVANGQPVTSGSVTFMPVDASEGAQPASGAVQSDGTFVVTTDKEGDGAAIGKHQVSFTPQQVTPPEWDGYGAQPPTPPTAFAGLMPKESQVEIKSGENELTIELVPATPR
jgi:hypothetical protein